MPALAVLEAKENQLKAHEVVVCDGSDAAHLPSQMACGSAPLEGAAEELL